MLYLLAKMIMQGHGDIQGLTCHMVSGEGCTFSGWVVDSATGHLAESMNLTDVLLMCPCRFQLLEEEPPEPGHNRHQGVSGRLFNQQRSPSVDSS